MQNFVKILRAVFEIWTKNIKIAPKMGVFPHLRPPKIFFQKSGSVTFFLFSISNIVQSFIEIVKAVFEIWTKNIKNAPKMGVFPDLKPPNIFFFENFFFSFK